MIIFLLSVKLYCKNFQVVGYRETHPNQSKRRSMSNQQLFEKYNELNCFGYLYDPILVTCRKTCEVRVLCHKKVKQRIREEGQEIFDNNKNSILIQNEIKDTDDQTIHIETTNSELVENIISYLKSFNLELINRQHYVALRPKFAQLNYFVILRRKATNFKKVIYFTRIGDIHYVPPALRKFLSEDKRANFRHYFTGRNMEELKTAVKLYLDFLAGENGTSED